MSEDTITITKKAYYALCRDSELLNCLEICGVRDWVRYDNALDMLSTSNAYNEEDEDEDNGL